ncbi:MAG: DUF433 domain-containing protein [Acidobacteriota bacterium]|nr:DUF433 domain-containing protein [Acidobacteriota bacterium]
MSEYITKLENGAYRIVDTRVSLDSVVYCFQRGDLPETIARKFPALNLAQVYGAIAFYLSNQTEIDEYLRQGEIEFEKFRLQQRQLDPEFYARFDKLRQERKEGSLLRT